MAKRKKAGGSNLSRSEVISVRLDTKLRWGAELAAKAHRRTLSSFIEWAVEDCLARNEFKGGLNGIEMMNRTWDVDEPDRFVNLATHFPELLTHEEQVLWKLIKETLYLWPAEPDLDGEIETRLNLLRLRELWEILKNVANGEETREKLPDLDPSESVEFYRNF